MRASKRVFVGTVLLSAAVIAGSVVNAVSAPTVAVAASRDLPAGFTDTVVAKLRQPVALAATPDGRLLVLEKPGQIRVIEDGTLLPDPALDISDKVCAANSERGLLGITLDPSFTTNGFIYVYYTFRKFPECHKDALDVPVNRVSRFTMVGNTVDPASEKILIDGMISYHGIHNAGDVGFGNDGLLYVSVGDGGCDYEGNHGCDTKNTIAQRGNTLQGKVLRIKANGAIPKNNPFTGPGTARCNEGAIAAGMTCQEIYLMGLRNPFRFAFDPNTTKTRMFVDDVGQGTWEEIDKAVAGANYGWPVREGRCAVGSLTDCGPPPPGFTNPIFSYPHHGAGCGAITGGAFVPADLWGSGFDGGYLYGDFGCSQISLALPTGAGGRWTSTPFATGLDVGGPVAMMFGPHAGSTALYYTTLANHGEVHVIDKS